MPIGARTFRFNGLALHAMAVSLLYPVLVAPAAADTGAATSPQSSAATPQTSAGDPAAAGDNGGIVDIIVTANRRAESAQKVPIAITAVTADRISNLGISDTSQLAAVVPGLAFQSNSAATAPHLRGIGSTNVAAGSENSVATYVDGVYIASLVGSMVQLSSIDQIDVLKGPQGTLFGRNATGGVVNIRTRDPKHELGGSATLRYGNYDTISGVGYVTSGITDNLAADFAGFFSNQGEGWGKNLVTGKDVNRINQLSVRSKWLFTPGERDQFRLIGDFSKMTGPRYSSYSPIAGSTVNTAGGSPYVFPGGFYDTATAQQPYQNYKGGGVSLQWDHEFDALRIMSLTAYRKSQSSIGWNNAPLPQNFAFADWVNKDQQFSQELQVASLAESRIQWLVGLYYLNGNSRYVPFNLSGLAFAPLERLSFTADAGVKSGAAFGQATVPLWEGAHLTGGLRYTIEKRSIQGETQAIFPAAFGLAPIVSGVTDAAKTFRKLTWRVAFDQQVTPEILAYASYNRGFKSGVYNSIPPEGPNAQPVQPEVLDAFEAGLKTDLFDRHVRLNLSGYYYSYSNIQVTVFRNSVSVLENGSQAKIYGLDLDAIVKPVDGLTLTGGMNLMHNEYTSYPGALFNMPASAASGGGVNGVPGDASGNKLTYAPELTFNVGANYSTPVGSGKAEFDVNYSYSSRWYALPDNILSQSPYGLLDASANYTFHGNAIQIGLWAKNLTDKKYYSFLSSSANPLGYSEGLPGAPRTYGVMVGVKF